MIVVRLSGGLGNQMFQYAAARRAALRNGTRVKVDLSFLDGRRGAGTPRRYFLGNLGVDAEPATGREVARLYGHGRTLPGRAWIWLCRAAGVAPEPRVIEERGTAFEPALLSATDDVYLIGCWQSERYFEDIAPQLRREFAPSAPLSGKNREVADALGAVESVAVHVRRGDYISDPAARRFHGVCDPGYYARCVEYVAERVPAPHLFVFSDEPDWVRENLSFPFPTTVVDNNPPDAAHEDLRLMRLCRHQVIANSSLGWWAAWLNENPSRIVLAPRAWYADPSMPGPSMPASWVRM
jgi:hypothetical protein